MDTLISVLQFLLSLSLLIALHEWGHFFFARLFKTRVNKFYLFFDFLFPIPTILNFALFKKKVGDTEYGIGWFPLGGYVQIDGMMDETQGADKLNTPPQPWEFRSKKPYQRLLIMMGGIIVNVLVAFIIYAGVLFIWGEQKILNSSVKDGIAVGDSILYEWGFKDGDKIVAVDGDTVKYFDDVNKKVLFGGKKVVVNRAGQTLTIDMKPDVLGQLSSKKIDKRGLFSISIPNEVGAFDTLDKESPQKSVITKAGVKAGDKIIGLNNTPIARFADIYRFIDKRKAGDSVRVTTIRGTDTLTYNVQLDDKGKLGLANISIAELEKRNLLQVYKKDYGFFEAIPAGINHTFAKLGDYVDQFKLIFTPGTGAYKGMGGFASMSKAFGGTWNWEAFWRMTAFFSVVLAFMNFLPIPMLDGGYILFTLVEMITGKKLPDSFVEKANSVGFFIIIGLMLFTNGNDIFRKIMGRF
jgi:regulator of sigma E protease